MWRQYAIGLFLAEFVVSAIRSKNAVGKELDCLEKEWVLEKVTHSDWASPIVAVPKGDDSFTKLNLKHAYKQWTKEF